MHLFLDQRLQHPLAHARDGDMGLLTFRQTEIWGNPIRDSATIRADW